MPKTSFVIRTFNEEKHLGNLLGAIAAQDYDDYEVVIVDSGSSDTTLEIARKFKARIVQIESKDFTFGHSLNVGVEAATGEYIICASAHVLPLGKDWIRSMIEPFADEKVAMVYGRQVGSPTSKYSEKRDFERLFGESEFDSRVFLEYANNANSAIRKALWQKHQFDPTLPGLEDLEWAKHMTGEGYVVRYAPRAAVYHIHEEKWHQVLNRYRREAVAAQHMQLPHPPQARIEFPWLVKMLLGDLLSALPVLTPALFEEILRFRYYQWKGTRLGWYGNPDLKVQAERYKLYYAPLTYKVLITAPYFQLALDDYRDFFATHGIELIVPTVNERMEEADLLPLMKDVDGILCGDDRITARVLDQAPKLKAIVKWGTGIDSIDKEAAKARGITVRNTPNAFTEPVADTVMSYILCFARNTIGLDRLMHQGGWEKQLNPALHECTLGIIGMGNIGQALARRAQAFGMRVIATDIVPKSFPNMVPLDELLAEADFVSVNCDLNPTSEHLMNAERFAKMKPTAYFLNAARGPIMDETALIEALQNKTIAGAGLDVFEHEPLPVDSPLRAMDNVILSPHNSNAGSLAWKRVHENSLRSLFEELSK
ncbi:MAG TPA: NAD(P)-dependent oxidoreductase [Candidatus Paceibacterota bacterium]|nr:NAD(P)-dependent oxidoreductase [Candidatus Paceibacterota bacterium]